MKQGTYARFFQRRFVWILVILSAFILLAGSLRGGITALPPIIGVVQKELGLSAAEAAWSLLSPSSASASLPR